MGCHHESGNQGLLLLAALTAIEIAQEMDEDQTALLSAFFVVLGDQLALLAAPPWRKDCCPGEGRSTPGTNGCNMYGNSP